MDKLLAFLVEGKSDMVGDRADEEGATRREAILNGPRPGHRRGEVWVAASLVFAGIVLLLPFLALVYDPLMRAVVSSENWYAVECGKVLMIDPADILIGVSLAGLISSVRGLAIGCKSQMVVTSAMVVNMTGLLAGMMAYL